MIVLEPLALLTAIGALVTAGYWFQVYQAIDDREANAAWVNRRLKLAASGSMITLTLGGISVLFFPVANLVGSLMM